MSISDDRLTKGDVAILKFLTAIELIESDLRQQYDELGGATTAGQSDCQLALQFLNRVGSKYITANAANEIEHSTFLRTCLESEGVEPVIDESGSCAAAQQRAHRTLVALPI